jgi:hypothetical protein
VTAIERDEGKLPQRDDVEIVIADLEGGAPWPLPGRKFGAVVVTNYLHRPLIPTLIESLSAGSVLIYETFMQGNERFGKPSNPDYLLKDGELLDLVRPLLCDRLRGADHHRASHGDGAADRGKEAFRPRHPGPFPLNEREKSGKRPTLVLIFHRFQPESLMMAPP